MDLSIPEALLVAAVLLVVSSALSGWLRGTVLSITVLAATAGAALSLSGLFSIDPGSRALFVLVELALLLTLFSDGLQVQREALRAHWDPPARVLVVAMPLTGAAIALAAKGLFPQLGWAEALLVGAALMPTDPVVTSALVTSERLPSVVRHTLNLESGLNDGLALPFVLFFLAAAEPGDAGLGQAAARLSGETLAGIAIGATLAAAAGFLLGHLPGGRMERRYEGLYALGTGAGAFGLAEATFGNGLVAAFTAGLVLAVTRHEIPSVFRDFNEQVSSIFELLAFFVFGGLVVSVGWSGSIPALVGFVAFVLVVARPAAVLVSFIGSGLPRPQQLFLAWFGPKGIASMLFALYILGSLAPDRTQVFELASFVILGSVLAHGLTETLGAGWIEGHVREQKRQQHRARAHEERRAA